MLTGKNIQFHLADLRDAAAMKDLFDAEKIDAVIHFLHHGGKRALITDPESLPRALEDGVQSRD